MKTKQDLLRVMRASFACWEAEYWVKDQRFMPAEQIGLSCQRPEWLVWFLWRALKPASREVFANRLGLQRDECISRWLNYSTHNVDSGTRPHVAFDHAAARTLDRSVIDDCWRAWCRS